MSLCHAIHYCYTQGWLVLHIPDGEETASYTASVCAEVQPVSDLLSVSLSDNTAHIWVKNCKELLPSSYNTSRFDQPLQAVEWLRNFRITNEHFLSKVCSPFHAGQLFGLEFKVKKKKQKEKKSKCVYIKFQ